MQNKVIQTSNLISKKDKEKDIPKKSLSIKSAVMSNNIELSKHKSLEIYGQYSPSNLTKNNNNNNSTLNNNNTKKNNTLANTIQKIIHYSGAKKQNNKNVLKNPKSKSKKEYGNININDILSSNNMIKTNSSDIKNGNSKTKKNYLDNILSESDSCQEIDSMDEENLSRGIKNSNQNLKHIPNIKKDNLDFKKHSMTGNNKTLNKNKNKENTLNKDNKNSATNNKNRNKISGKKKNKKLSINDDFEDTDEEIIVDDNEFDNSKFILNDKMIETKFPKLSSNPFIGQKNNIIKNEEYRKAISSKEYGPKTKKSESQAISSHHIKSTTLGTVVQKGTNHNSSNLSNTMDLIFNNSIDELYRNFLLISKKGDKEKFLEILGKINNLPENLRNINYQDENGFSALHYSSDEGNLKIVDILLESNCEINIKNSFDQTPLHLSSKRGYFDISKKLLDGGALLNAFDKEKNSPIHYVCENNHIELLNFFLTKLPQVDTLNIYGKKPIDLTTNKNIKEILEKYMKKNSKSFHKIKIYQTTDSKMKNLIEKQKEGDSSGENKRINTSSQKSKNSSLSPKSKKNNKNKINISKSDYNSVQNLSNIKKQNTINVNQKKSNLTNIERENDKNTINKLSPKNSSIKNSANSNMKKDGIKTSFKPKDNIINTTQKKKNEKNNDNKNRKINLNIKDSNTINTSQKENKKKIKNIESSKNSNYDNLIKSNKNIINVLKKTKTLEQFSTTQKNNLNYANLINKNSQKIKEINIDPKLNNSNDNIITINNSTINTELNRINLSFNSKKNKSKSKEKKEDNLNNKRNTDIKSKVPNDEIKYKKLRLDQIEHPTAVINLNKTEENVNDVSKISKKSIQNSYCVLNQNKNKKSDKHEINNSIRKIDNKEKKLSGSKTKKKKKKLNLNNQTKNEENISNKNILFPSSLNQNNNHFKFNMENSYTSPSPTNNNRSKITSYMNNQNKIYFDNIDKLNITEQTIQDNLHSEFNSNSIEEEERISPSSFICLAQLGKGSFGEVYLVQKINTKEKFAMKVLRKERIIAQNLLKYAIAERNVLSLSNHPFIVKLNFAFQTSSKLFLILEYCSNGDLARHLLFEKRFSESRAKFYICEVLLALENLHQRDIIFRDLKPDNVVLDGEGHCKLTDFGLSKEGVGENQSASSFCGSIAYLAPEMLKKQGHGKAVDWYLLGVLLYEMLVGITPFFTSRKEDIFHNIEFEELKIPEFIQPDTASLLKGLLQKDPRKRLGGGNRDALEIKEHPYFRDVNWDDVYNKRIIPPPVNVFTKNIMHVYQKPRLFANDDNLNISAGKTNPNMLPGWSFVNNEKS